MLSITKPRRNWKISKLDNNKIDQEYVYGYDSAMTMSGFTNRTAEKQAGWFLPYLKPGMTLLDVGCASGSITFGLAKAVEPGQVIGIDISEVEIERATNGKISNIWFDLGNA